MVRCFKAYEAMTMTELLCHTDSYVQECDATVVAVAVEACEARHPHA